MLPPIQSLVMSSAQVVALLDNDPTRFYAFGSAPELETRPYAVWQIVNGTPDNFINDRPDIDDMGIQVDIYAPTMVQAVAVASAIRDAIEGDSHITLWRGMGLDEKTKLYRFTFLSDWFTPR